MSPDLPVEPIPTPPLRTWRPMALWSAGILLALGLLWFIGAVVVPVWQVRAEFARAAAKNGKPTAFAWEQLGNRGQAIRKLRLYLRAPAFAAKDKYLAVYVLSSMSEDAVRPLIEELGNPDPEVRRTAATELGNLGAADAAPAITKLLADRDPVVRMNVADTLRRLNAVHGEAVPLLIGLLDDAGPEGKFRHLRQPMAGAYWVGGVVPNEVRHHAAMALAQGGPRARAAAPALLRVACTRDADRDLRCCALVALGKIGPDGNPASRDLLGLLEDSDGQIRAAAAWALGRLPPAPAGLVPRLVRQLADPNIHARLCAAESLGLFGTAATEAVPQLIDVLEDAEARARGEAGRLSPPAPDAEVEVVSKRCEPLRVMHKWHEEMRCAAMEALGRIGPAAKSAVPALVRALELKGESPNYSIEDCDRCRIAAEAIGGIGPDAEAAVPSLVKLLGTWVNDGGVTNSAIAEALGRIGPAAVPAIIQCLRDGKGDGMAALALGMIGPPARAAVPELIKLLDNEYMPARIDAAWALGRIGPAAAEAVPRLEAMLKDREVLSAAAAEALKNIRGEPTK
jgi:HEAT repeat protein